MELAKDLEWLGWWLDFRKPAQCLSTWVSFHQVATNHSDGTINTGRDALLPVHGCQRGSRIATDAPMGLRGWGH